MGYKNSEDLKNLSKIELIKDYISVKSKDIASYNTENEVDKTLLINGRNLTNIGVFRKYIERYLLRNDNISNEDTIMVRQLNPTPNGLPLEIYCFAKTSVWVEYEQVQANLFDHLLTAANYFDLEVVQVNLEL